MIRQLRENKNLSIRTLSKRSGVSPSTIFRLEKHGGRCNISTLKAIASALDAKAEDLAQLNCEEEINGGLQ
jgi:transcriptional regulator with XRE-family HTH domain